MPDGTPLNLTTALSGLTHQQRELLHWKRPDLGFFAMDGACLSRWEVRQIAEALEQMEKTASAADDLPGFLKARGAAVALDSAVERMSAACSRRREVSRGHGGSHYDGLQYLRPGDRTLKLEERTRVWDAANAFLEAVRRPEFSSPERVLSAAVDLVICLGEPFPEPPPEPAPVSRPAALAFEEAVEELKGKDD